MFVEEMADFIPYTVIGKTRAVHEPLGRPACSALNRRGSCWGQPSVFRLEPLGPALRLPKFNSRLVERAESILYFRALCLKKYMNGPGAFVMKSKVQGGLFDPERVHREIQELEERSGQPDLWNDPEEGQRVMTELTRKKETIEPWNELATEIGDAVEMLELAREEGDEDAASDVEQTLEDIAQRYEKYRISVLLSGEHDDSDAFLTIHSGAGGTEACDWASMLLRMYTRWLESSGYKYETLEFLEAEGGVKSVTLQVTGAKAFGYLKGETGVHRLVRISPFDSSGRRHTSFASVYVSPVIDDTIEVDIKPDELRVDTYRAQGAGGQHVNKTDSAVRMTHLETGIVVQCQNERSQHKNREMAMKMLRSRLYEYYRAQREAERAENAAEKHDIAWGSQIRSYVFQPYTMVKDHRTKEETGNVQAVMDGDLDRFIESYLRSTWQPAQVGE